LQAFNQLAVPAADLAFHVIAGSHRLGFAFGICFNTIGFNALSNQVILHRIRTTLGELLIVGIGADTVGMAGHQHHFNLRICLHLANDFVIQLLLAIGVDD